MEPVLFSFWELNSMGFPDALFMIRRLFARIIRSIRVNFLQKLFVEVTERFAGI